MQRMEFNEAVEAILEKDDRYDSDAYAFLRDALDFTLKSVDEEVRSENRHVDGEQLLAGFRDYALEEFGPMAITVLDEWGIRRSDDVGEMVFNWIEAGVFGKSEADNRDDFIGVFDFAEVFTAPFMPKGANAIDLGESN
jgi:uncharacterized repeat protein (TIGR04138 family)